MHSAEPRQFPRACVRAHVDQNFGVVSGNADQDLFARYRGEGVNFSAGNKGRSGEVKEFDGHGWYRP